MHKYVELKTMDETDMNRNITLTESPIFIGGTGRSGTTLLRSLLSAHSRICITPETQFMSWVDKQEDVHGSPDDFDSFWKSYTSWVRFKDLDIDADRCLELIDMQGDRTFQSIFRAVLTAYSEHTGKPIVGEKSPSHTRYLSTLLDWFPSAHVLIMQRDPRAVVASQMGTPYVQDRITPTSIRRGLFVENRLIEIIRYADNWAERFEKVVPQWESDPRVMVISYENLVHDPGKELRSICQFLGEEYEENMLAGRKKESVPMPAGKTTNERLEQWRRKHHAKSLRPISTKSLNKWKKNLSELEISIVEGRCIEGMRICGYTPITTAGMRRKGRLFSQAFLTAEKSESFARKLFKKIRKQFS